MNTDNERISSVLNSIGFEKLNGLQEETLKKSKSNNNILLLSQTGSGKTFAFLLPLFLNLDPKAKHIQSIVLAPSRELAQQIETVWRTMKTNYKVLSCYGGHSIAIEKKSLIEAPAILIGTPGRICDHISRESLDLSNLSHLVIDEYDKCLEFGFDDQLKFICQNLHNLKSTTLVSATEHKEFPAYFVFKNPAVVNFLTESKDPDITFWHFPIKTLNKFDRLYDLLCTFKGELTIVFCNFREATERVRDFLQEKNFESIVYHGGMEQDEREKALIKFKNCTYHTLICTDLGSRGLDISAIQHVVHFQFPQSEEAFIHRNGRTARMTANGSSYLLINREEKLPEYLHDGSSEYKIPSKIETPRQSPWTTLYFSGGKKDKINKVDLVGFLSQKGGLKKEDIGLIIVQDFSSYVAVKRSGINLLLTKIQAEKVKGKKLKIDHAK